MVERVVLKLLRRRIQQQKSVTQCKQHKKKESFFLGGALPGHSGTTEPQNRKSPKQSVSS